MKKIYLFIAITLLANYGKAQLSLTQSGYEPIANVSDLRDGFDSVNAIPRNSGTNQLWDFSAMTTNTASTYNTYSVSSSVPGGTAYPTATLAQYDGTNYSYFKSSTNMFEMLALTTNSVTLTFTNTAVIANWPINYNYSASDPVAGTLNSSFGSGTFTGTLNTAAPGTGTLQLPFSHTLTSCIQVTSTLNINATITVSMFPVPVTFVITNYQYYTNGLRFPALTVTTTRLKSAIYNSTITTINADNACFTGVNELSGEAEAFSVYPNPAQDKLMIELSGQNDAATIEISNQLGQTVKSAEPAGLAGSSITLNTADLPRGIYFVKVKAGSRETVKKILLN